MKKGHNFKIMIPALIFLVGIVFGSGKIFAQINEHDRRLANIEHVQGETVKELSSISASQRMIIRMLENNGFRK